MSSLSWFKYSVEALMNRQPQDAKKVSVTGAGHLHLASCSYGDRWGATDLATLSLHLILF